MTSVHYPPDSDKYAQKIVWELAEQVIDTHEEQPMASHTFSESAVYNHPKSTEDVFFKMHICTEAWTRFMGYSLKDVDTEKGLTF